MLKVETSAAAWSPCPDRFVTEGYRSNCSWGKDALDQLTKVNGLTGIGVGWGSLSSKNPEMTDSKFINGGYISRDAWPLAPVEDLDWLFNYCKEKNLGIGTIAPDTYQSPIFKNGTLMNRDPAIRRLFIEHMKQGLDLAATIPGCDVLVWLAHDGYDYPFEDDYRVRWAWLIEGLQEICEYNKNVKVTIEYKAKEPRTRQYISDYGKSLLICKETKADNLGVVVDIGHSLFAGENPSEAVDIVSYYGKLNHIHMNDNYRSWDDDLFPGAIHFWETLEMFYVLNKYNYDGWYNMDVWPTRVDGHKIVQEGIDRIYMFDRLAKTLPIETITKMQAENDTIGVQKLVRELTIK